jgi:hypothetical protein
MIYKTIICDNDFVQLYQRLKAYFVVIVNVIVIIIAVAVAVADIKDRLKFRLVAR